MIKVINGNNIELLKQYPDNYFDAIVTDPPYGLGKEPDATELMKDWIEKGYHEVKGSGFMGKEWDAFVPQPIFWKECFRVLKHGGHVLAFYGSRTYDWGVMAMRFAGFEVRDTITWHFGSGFPKSHNISKAIDKMYGAERTEVIGKRVRNVKPYDDSNGWNENNTSGEFEYKAPATDQAKQWDGWGSALKPASEYICLARKPLEKGLSIAENVLKWGVGAINIDGCRVGFKNETDNRVGTDAKYSNTSESDFFKGIKNNQQVYDSQGRFPANLILTHHPECECVGTKKVKTGKNIEEKGSGGIWQKSSGLPCGNQYGDENGEETIEDWNCHPDCPIKILDEQSGELKSGKMTPNHKRTTNGSPNGIYGKFDVSHPLAETYGDKGGASRFFYVAKASKSERNKGLEGFEEKENMRVNAPRESEEEKVSNKMSNFHPTVKPIKLMQYLVRLVTPPNGIVLDPFCGSGTTGVACKLDGFQFVGMEQDQEYTKIAQARIENYEEDKKDIAKKNNPKKDDNKNNIQSSLF
jgi:site-specific DNA-methyltransferase (adenine-specific)